MRTQLMESEAWVTISIEFSDRELESEQLERQALQLMNELNKIENVKINRVQDPSPPIGHKSVGSFFAGILTTKVNVENAKKVINFLNQYFMGKSDRPLKIKAEVSGKKVEVEAANINDLKEALREIDDFFK